MQDSDPIDEAKVKKLVTNFDKKMLKNQELRIKFPDDPRKLVPRPINKFKPIDL